MSLPSPQPKFMPYLTIIPSRRPEQKTHTNLGHAKNAVNGKMNRYTGAECDMEIHKYSDSGWELAYRIEKGTKVLPWQVEKLEKQIEQQEAEAARKKQGLHEEATTKAHAAFDADFGGTAGDVFEDRMEFVYAYVQGYKEAHDEYKLY